MIVRCYPETHEIRGCNGDRFGHRLSENLLSETPVTQDYGPQAEVLFDIKVTMIDRDAHYTPQSVLESRMIYMYVQTMIVKVH